MPNLSAAELAESYGFAYAFLKSDRSLWKLFNAAVKGNWTSDKFTVELKNTSWWRKNADSVRQYKYLSQTDPATLASRRQAMYLQLRDTVAGLGGSITPGGLAKFVSNALLFNWNEAQIREYAGGTVRAMNGIYYGQAGTDAGSIKQTAWRNGVRISDTTMQSWVQAIAQGNMDTNYYQNYIRKQAKSLAPGYADQLDAGMDLYDLANPYIQAKASILEKDPQSIDLFDPDIRKALSATDEKGQPASQSLWQFELSMRKNPEWRKTKNAQDAAAGAARQVLTDFGFQGV